MSGFDSSKFKIVEATPDDAAVVTAFVRKLGDFMNVLHRTTVTEDKMRELLKSGDGNAIIGMVDNTPAAVLYYYVIAPSLMGERGYYLDSMFIEEEYRRNGIGRMMIKHLAQKAVDNGYKRLEWTCFDWNKSAMDLYKKIGASTMDSIIIHRVPPEEIK